MLNDAFKRRFVELETSMKQMPRRPNYDSSGENIEQRIWKQWATSAQSLILAIYGSASPHYTNFVDSFKKCHGYDYQVDELGGIFLSAKEDFEGGYVFNVELRVSGEVFGDFVAIAKQSLAEGHKDVASVLACAALEDALKKFAAINQLDVSQKTMSEVINGLKSKGLVSGAQKSLLDTMPKIRDYAMHANWNKIEAPDVSSVIGFVEQFLISKFS